MDTAVSPMIAKIRLVNFLRQSGAQTVAGLARALTVPAELLRRLLDELVAIGKVEALRPVRDAATTDPERSGEYFRWIHNSDFENRWQLRLLRQPRLSGYKLDRRLASLMDR